MPKFCRDAELFYELEQAAISAVLTYGNVQAEAS